MQSNKSLNLRSEACTGGKHSKICLTGMAAANAMGDKILMFVIGKSVDTGNGYKIYKREEKSSAYHR